MLSKQNSSVIAYIVAQEILPAVKLSEEASYCRKCAQIIKIWKTKTKTI